MKRLLLLAVLAVSLPAARAADFLACPPWEITVVDEEGKPLQGCVVMQEWGCDFKGVYVTGSTNATTGPEGRVSFPARKVSPPPRESRWKRIERFIDRGTQEKFGSGAFISKPGYQFEWVNSRSDPRTAATREGLRSKVVLKAEKR